MLLVQYVIGQKEGTRWAGDLVVTHGKYGKPSLGNREYGYNLTDEAGVASVLFDFEGDPVGADLSNPKDIEQMGIEDLRDFYRTEFRDIFTDAEVAALEQRFQGLSREGQLELLAKVWAEKESQSKLAGFGLHKGLQRYESASLGLHSAMAPAFSLGKTGMLCALVGSFRDVEIHQIDLTKMVEDIKEVQY